MYFVPFCNKRSEGWFSLPMTLPPLAKGHDHGDIHAGVLGGTWWTSIQTVAVVSDSGKAGVGGVVKGGRGCWTLAVCWGVTAWLFFLCDLLTRPRTHSHNMHVMFSLGRHVVMTCMNHCGIPHGFAGGVLATHRILFFPSLTHFCSTPKTLSVTRPLEGQLWT